MAVDYLLKNEKFNVLVIVVKFENILKSLTNNKQMKDPKYQYYKDNILLSIISTQVYDIVNIFMDQKSYSKPMIFFDVITGSSNYYKSYSIFKQIIEDRVFETNLKYIRYGNGQLYEYISTFKDLFIISANEIPIEMIHLFKTYIERNGHDKIRLLTNLSTSRNKEQGLGLFLKKIGPKYVIFMDRLNDLYIKPSVMMIIRNSFQPVLPKIFRQFEEDYNNKTKMNHKLYSNTLIMCLYLTKRNMFSYANRIIRVDKNNCHYIIYKNLETRQTVHGATVKHVRDYREYSIVVIDDALDFMNLWQLYVQVYFYNNKI